MARGLLIYPRKMDPLIDVEIFLPEKEVEILQLKPENLGTYAILIA